MDVVSFETGIKLRDAGFPQPKEGYMLFGYDFFGAIVPINGRFDAECYAPTATDILQQIGMAIEWVDTPFDGPYWVCWDNSMTRKYDPTMHDNPAEAAAAMFLQMKNKNG